MGRLQGWGGGLPGILSSKGFCKPLVTSEPHYRKRTATITFHYSRKHCLVSILCFTHFATLQTLPSSRGGILSDGRTCRTSKAKILNFHGLCVERSSGLWLYLHFVITFDVVFSLSLLQYPLYFFNSCPEKYPWTWSPPSTCQWCLLSTSLFVFDGQADVRTVNVWNVTKRMWGCLQTKISLRFWMFLLIYINCLSLYFSSLGRFFIISVRFLKIIL